LVRCAQGRGTKISGRIKTEKVEWGTAEEQWFFTTKLKGRPALETLEKASAKKCTKEPL